MDTGLIPYAFGSMMMVGMMYLVISLMFGELFEFDGLFDGLELELEFLENDSGTGLGCGAIAAFLASFGAAALASSLSGANLFVNMITGLAFGVIMARLVAFVFGYLKRQESTRVTSEESLIGKIARATISVAPGMVGEAMVDAEQKLKYPVREIEGEALQRGDRLEIVEVSGSVLDVRKI